MIHKAFMHEYSQVPENIPRSSQSGVFLAYVALVNGGSGVSYCRPRNADPELVCGVSFGSVINQIR